MSKMNCKKISYSIQSILYFALMSHFLLREFTPLNIRLFIFERHAPASFISSWRIAYWSRMLDVPSVHNNKNHHQTALHLQKFMFPVWCTFLLEHMVVVTEYYILYLQASKFGLF